MSLKEDWLLHCTVVFCNKILKCRRNVVAATADNSFYFTILSNFVIVTIFTYFAMLPLFIVEL